MWMSSMRSREKGENIRCDSWQSLDNVMEQCRRKEDLRVRILGGDA